jgi:hypothetical protein
MRTRGALCACASTSAVADRSEGEDHLPWLVGPYFLRLIKNLQEICPPDAERAWVQFLEEWLEP